MPSESGGDKADGIEVDLISESERGGSRDHGNGAQLGAADALQTVGHGS